MGFGLWVVIYSLGAMCTFYTLLRICSAQIGENLGPALALAVIAAASILTFWFGYFVPFFPVLMNIGYWLFAALSAAYVLLSPIDRKALIPSLLWGGSTFVLLMWAFSPMPPEGPLSFARHVWSHPLPGDNEIPLAFANVIRVGEIPSPAWADWLSSDRPPLQTGYFLLTHIPKIGAEQSYQIASTAAQMLIIPYGYYLVLTLTRSTRAAIISALILFFAPLTLLNGIFVWPKLFAATFLIAAATVHFTELYKTERYRWQAGAIVGALSAAAMLSHGASAFALLGFGITALMTRRLASVRYVAAAALVSIAMYLPWTAYQKYADPPGDRLLKWHLAGVIPADDPRSVGEAIADAYAGIGPVEFIGRQVAKIKDTAAKPLAAYAIQDGAQTGRKNMFFNFIPSMGFVGLFAALNLFVGLFYAATRPLSLAILNSYFAMILASYETDLSVHVSSYFSLCGTVLLFGAICSRQPKLLVVALAGQVIHALLFYS